jgi:hypothetical protein
LKFSADAGTVVDFRRPNYLRQLECHLEEVIMIVDGSLIFREFAMNEPAPLAVIHNSVLEFLQGRDDAVLFGAQAVNAYIDEPRMTQDVDVLSTHAASLAEELRQHLNDRFKIAVGVREVGEGLGQRIYQLTKPKNRHLVDVRQVDVLPAHAEIGGVQVLTPLELLASKVISYARRKGKPKAGTDWRDIAYLLLKFPEFRSEQGPVLQSLVAANSPEEIIETWRKLVAEEISSDDDDGEFA